MKRVITVFIFSTLIAFLGWVGLAWFLGGAVETRTQEIVSELNAQVGGSGAPVFIEEESFQRGLFASVLTLKVSSLDEAVEHKDLFYVENKIYHGPFFLTPDGVRFGPQYMVSELDVDRLKGELAALVKEGFGGKSPVVTRTLVTVSGAMEVSIESPEFELELDDAEDGAAFSVDGLDGSFLIDKEGTSVVGDMELGAVELNSLGFSLAMDGGTGTFNIDEFYKGVTLYGDSQMSFPGMEITVGDSVYEVGEAELKTETTHNGKNVRKKNEFRYASVSGPDGMLPLATVTGNGGRFEFRATGLDIEGLKQMADAQEEVNQFIADALKAGEVGSASETPKVYQAYLETVANLLKPDLAFKWQVRFDGLSGASKLDLDLKYADERKLTELNTLNDVVEALDARAFLSINREVLPKEEIEALLGQFMDSGMVNYTTTAYESTATLKDGAFSVNGQKTTFLDAAAPMLEQPIPWDIVLGSP